MSPWTHKKAELDFGLRETEAGFNRPITTRKAVQIMTLQPMAKGRGEMLKDSAHMSATN